MNFEELVPYKMYPTHITCYVCVKKEINKCPVHTCISVSNDASALLLVIITITVTTIKVVIITVRNYVSFLEVTLNAG
jgi:hypothetical protein